MSITYCGPTPAVSPWHALCVRDGHDEPVLNRLPDQPQQQTGLVCHLLQRYLVPFWQRLRHERGHACYRVRRDGAHGVVREIRTSLGAPWRELNLTITPFTLNRD
jgi:hypothetical protein